MSLIFAGIIPHSPATLPHLASTQTVPVTQTLEAIKELEGELYVMQPDVLLIISPHAPLTKEAFSLNLAPQFTTDLQEFGEPANVTRAGDIALTTDIREYADAHRFGPVTLFSEPNLDYGTGVALFHLAQHLPNVKIVPVSISLLSIEDHYNFGKTLRQVATNSNKRVAIIASTGLAHVFPDGKTFDESIKSSLEKNQLTDIVKLNSTIVQSAQAVNGQKTLALLFGALSEITTTAKTLSYESPLGVGWLVGQFNLI